jgi:hypothetical protein
MSGFAFQGFRLIIQAVIWKTLFAMHLSAGQLLTCNDRCAPGGTLSRQCEVPAGSYVTVPFVLRVSESHHVTLYLCYHSYNSLLVTSPRSSLENNLNNKIIQSFWNDSGNVETFGALLL